MAYVPNNLHQYPEWGDIGVKEYAIGGKLLSVNVVINDMQLTMYPTDQIKRELVSKLAEYMLENKFVEFTKIPSIQNMNTTFNARCYVAPDSQVKILRSLK